MIARHAGGIAIGEPDLSVTVLPREHPQRQIEADRLLLLHERRASLGIAEQQDRGGAERQSHGSRACLMVDPSEDGCPRGAGGALQSIKRRVERIWTRFRDEVDSHRGYLLLSEFVSPWPR